MIKIKNILLYALLTICVVSDSETITGQIIADGNAPYNSSTYLVNNILLGTGVVANNVSFSGDPLQIGYFNGVNSNLGLDSGIVMSTGNIDYIEPNGLAVPLTTPVNGDADLLSVANSVPPLIGQGFTVTGVNDICVLEFDFVPSSDTVQFRYVFGSDEYHTWVNSQYNDIFGFFISGPGLTGPHTSPAGFPNGAINIAEVPNSNPSLPITVSSVNLNINTQYFIDNPLGSPNRSVNLNGFTTVLTATAVVIPCETYHIRLAVADGSDNALDSGVFLEAKSFSSSSVVVSASPPNVSGTNAGADTALYEGCGPVVLTFSRSGDLSLDATVGVTLSGDAIEGTDFSVIPDSITFLANQDTVSISFDPLVDGVADGIDTLVITIEQDTGCAGIITAGGVLVLTISDPLPLTLVTTGDTLSCLEDSVAIFVQVTDGIPGFNYSWSTGESNDTIWVAPGFSSDYYVTVTDGCNIYTTVDTANVYVPVFPISTSTTDQSINCPGDSAQISVQAGGGTLPYNYMWSTGSSNDSLWVYPLGDSLFYVTVTDLCGIDTIVDSVNVFVVQLTPLSVYAGINDTIYCPGDPLAFVASASGGAGGYLFSWDNWSTFNDSLTINPMTTTSFTVGVTDACRQDTAFDQLEVYVPTYLPISFNVAGDTVICPLEEATLIAVGSGGTGNYSFAWSDFLPSNDTVTVNPPQAVSYQLTITDDCGNIFSDEVEVNIQVPKAAFDFEYGPDFVVRFTDKSSSDVVYWSWSFGDGDDSNEQHPEYVYNNLDEYIVELEVWNQYGCNSSIFKRVVPPMMIWFPNAFSPDGDGMNDYWKAYGEGIEKYKLKMFNRWGDLIWTSEDVNEMWDGKVKNRIIPQGVYIYHVEVSGFGTRIEKRGYVTVIR